MWIQAAILVLLLVIAYRFWKTQPKREVRGNTARLYFFYTTWCGYSKKAMPEWEKVKADLKTSAVFGKTTVEPVDIDAEKDAKTASLYEVAGYPTIKLETSSGPKGRVFFMILEKFQMMNRNYHMPSWG